MADKIKDISTRAFGMMALQAAAAPTAGAPAKQDEAPAAKEANPRATGLIDGVSRILASAHLTFEQQRARQFVMYEGKTYDWTWQPGAAPAKPGATGASDVDTARAARQAKTGDDTGKLIRQADHLQAAIYRIDAAIAEGKGDRGKLEAERAEVLAGLTHVVGVLQNKAALRVTSGDIQRANEWAKGWEDVYPAVSGKQPAAKPKASGVDEFAVSSSSGIGELMRSESALFGLYHRNMAEANRLEDKGGDKKEIARLRDEATKAQGKVGQIEGWIRARESSPIPMEAQRATDWIKAYQTKNWDTTASTPAADAGKPTTGLSEARKAIAELKPGATAGQIIRAHDAAYYALKSLDDQNGGEAAELRAAMAKAKAQMAGNAAGPPGFDRARAKEWLDHYGATYEQPPRPAKPATGSGTLQDFSTVDASSSFGALVRSLSGLNGLYLANMAAADEAEAKGDKDGAAKRRDEAHKARNEFGRVESLLRAKNGSPDAMERQRAKEWFDHASPFNWDHKASGGKPGERPNPADQAVSAADSMNKLIAKYEALYARFKTEQDDFAADKKDEHRAKADAAKSEAAKVLALISAKQ